MDVSFALEEFGIGMGIFSALYSMGVSLFSIALYVLRAAGFYTIAKRRGINHPWMSWIPILDLWVLGCISDQFQYVVKGKDRNKRKWMLGLSIALAVVYIVFFVILGVTISSVIVTAAGGTGADAVLEAILGPVATMMICIIPMVALSIAVMVIRYVAMYDLFTSCNPQNNVLFLVLSIFFNVTEPFFVFFNRNGDEGMPPRRAQPQYIPPQPQQEPWETANPQ
jgi:hypothetical protein